MMSTTRENAEARFAEYFVRNYPGPNTIISNPHWHAPKIFRAALAVIKDTGLLTEPLALEALAQPEDSTPVEVLRDGSVVRAGHKLCRFVLPFEIELPAGWEASLLDFKRLFLRQSPQAQEAARDILAALGQAASYIETTTHNNLGINSPTAELIREAIAKAERLWPSEVKP
jgi:hypothetical protein